MSHIRKYVYLTDEYKLVFRLNIYKISDKYNIKYFKSGRLSVFIRYGC